MILRISEACGFAINEQDLTPRTRQSINGLANVLRQVVMIKQLVLFRQKSTDTLGSRISRTVARKKEDVELGKNLARIESLQNALNERMVEVSRQVLNELEARQTLIELQNKAVQGQVPGATRVAPTHFEVEAMKCSNCGASLGIPNGGIVKCDFCGTVYTLNEYLDRLGESIRGDATASKAPGP